MVFKSKTIKSPAETSKPRLEHDGSGLIFAYKINPADLKYAPARSRITILPKPPAAQCPGLGRNVHARSDLMFRHRVYLTNPGGINLTPRVCSLAANHDLRPTGSSSNGKRKNVNIFSVIASTFASLQCKLREAIQLQSGIIY